MAYDRYENRRDREWRGSDQDRSSRDPSSMSSDRSSYERGRRDERGFWERAGDEVASWFGDDDSDRSRNESDRMSRGREDSWSGMTSGGWAAERDSERGYGRDFDRNRDRDRDRYAYRGSQGNRSSRSGMSGYGGYDRDMSARGGFGGSSNPDYMSPTGPSFGYEGTYGAGSRSGYGSGGYGRSYGGGSWGAGGGSTSGSSDRDSDRHYYAWRNRQMDELDRDYDRYNRERQDKFENDFGSWRQNRMSKRGHLGTVREHMDVVGSDGETIGKVDKVRGDHIILTKSDSPDGRHHAIDCSMIQSVDSDQVKLEMPAEEAKSRWEDSDGRGIFGSESSRKLGRDRDREEDTNLNRAFAGTYDDDR